MAGSTDVDFKAEPARDFDANPARLTLSRSRDIVRLLGRCGSDAGKIADLSTGQNATLRSRPVAAIDLGPVGGIEGALPCVA